MIDIKNNPLLIDQCHTHELLGRCLSRLCCVKRTEMVREDTPDPRGISRWIPATTVETELRLLHTTVLLDVTDSDGIERPWTFDYLHEDEGGSIYLQFTLQEARWIDGRLIFEYSVEEA